jgi:hypothetical protein
MCHVDDSKLIQEALPVCPVRLHVHQQAVYNLYQVTDPPLYLWQPTTSSSSRRESASKQQ